KVAHWTLDGLGTRAKLVKQERIVDNALDPYALTKDMFLQHTQAKVGGTSPAEPEVDLDAYEAELNQ
ncbi:MAG: MlaA family lipoprotein, partial [Aeromonas sp.]